ncbi:MAG TPA: type II toxin-antitoxin system RelE/ParE family toxin [Terriglobales bacterium]|nr:type II toxin-antitoxin system RelE/ParE family toxin [Terriglobales bacterium]
MTEKAPSPELKPLVWIGDTLREVRKFPKGVKRTVGRALALAQMGAKHPASKPWKGEGPGVFEIVEDDQGSTYRALYTVRFADVIYALYAFQKKSKKGIRTPQQDVENVHKRLQIAQQHYEESHGKRNR